MKNLLKALLYGALLVSVPLSFVRGATANEYYFTKRNAGNTANEQKTVVPVADYLLYFDGSLNPAVASITAAGRSILDDASVGAIRTTLGVGTGDSPTFAGLTVSGTITVGADTNLYRSAANRLQTDDEFRAASLQNTPIGNVAANLGIFTYVRANTYGYGVNANPDAQVANNFQPTVSSGAASGAGYGIYLAPQGTYARNTSYIYGIKVDPYIAKAGYTGLNLYGLFMSNGSVTGTGTIDNRYHIYLETPLGGTANYSIYSAGGNNTFLGGINATPVGNVTPSTGAFTTLSASSGLNSTTIGATTPAAATFIGITNRNGNTATGFLLGANNAGTTSTDAQIKNAVVAVPHYTIAEEPTYMVGAINGSGYNRVRIGGGNSLANAATEIDFYTAADAVTVTGTRRGGFTATGQFQIATTTASTDTTTGAVTIAGGLGVAGAVNAGAGGFTSLVASSGINSTNIGATVRGTGAFTTLAASGTVTLDASGGAAIVNPSPGTVELRIGKHTTPQAGIFKMVDTDGANEIGRFARESAANISTFSLGTTDSIYGQINLKADTLSGRGIGFGTDTNLYRNAAGSLKMDGMMEVGGIYIGSYFGTTTPPDYATTLSGVSSIHGLYGYPMNIEAAAGEALNIVSSNSLNIVAGGLLTVGGTSMGNAFSIMQNSVNTGSTTAYTGVYLSPQLAAALNTYYYAFISSPTIPAAAMTLPILTHFYAYPQSFGAGSSVTVQTGFEVAAGMTGGVTDYGFRGQIPAAANQWNLYMDGTATNYLAGNLGIGTTATTYGQLNLASTSGATQGIGFGTDTNLYRRGANLLTTDDNFEVTVYTSTSAGNGLTVYRTNTAGVGSGTTRGAMIGGGVSPTSGTVAEVSGLYSYADMGAGVGATITLATGVRAFVQNIPNGTITTAADFQADDITSSNATTRIAYRGLMTSGTGKYNLYMSGSAQNYLAGTFTVANSIVSSHATAGLGYVAGAGGAVTQLTSRTTGVTLDKVTGAITLFSAAGSATWQSFTVTNAAVAATDVIVVNQKSGTDLYEMEVTAVAAGSFRITYRTTGGTTTEQPVFNFVVIKGAAS